MAIRFDLNEIKIRKPEITPEGYLRSEAVFARDGILEYRMPTGNIRRELRLPEENQKAITGFGLKGLSVEHPPVLLDSSNSKDFVVGMSDSNVVYDKGGFVRGVITLFDSKAIELVQSGQKVEISAGYQCRVEECPGVWKGQKYDAIQRDLQINHIALTAKGRAGSDVRVLLDSANETDPDVGIQVFKQKHKMARITIDSVIYEDEIPSEIATKIGQKLTELDNVKSRADSLEKDLKAAQSELEEVVTDRDRAYGRADGFSEVVDAAIPLLGKLGYKWDSDAESFVRSDAKAKAKDEEDEEDDYEDEDENEEEEEETPPAKKPKSKKSTKSDSVADLVSIWRDAEALIPGIGSSRFDSDLSVADVQKLVIAELNPEINLQGRSDAFIAGVYEHLKLDSQEEEGEEVDAEESTEVETEHHEDSHIDHLSEAIKSTRSDRNDAKKSCSSPISEADQKRMDRYKQPLGMSKLSK
jgi:hypothetical protein